MAGKQRRLEIKGYEQGTTFGPQSFPKQDVHSVSTTQQHALGTRYVEGSRTFRYAKNGAVALGKALMTQSAVVNADTENILQTGHTWAVGDISGTVLVVTGGTYATDLYKDGYLWANDVNEVGDVYPIVASNITTTDTIMDIELGEPIRNALAATTDVSIQVNRFRDVVVFATTTTGFAAGVPLVDVPIDNYCWLQTGGACPVIIDTSETLVIGDPTSAPATYAVPGACGVFVTLNQTWGHVLNISGGGADAGLIELNID